MYKYLLHKISLSFALLAMLSIIIAYPGFTGVAQAKLIIKEQTKFYMVSGKTGKQVHKKLGRGGPLWMRKKHGIAGTQSIYKLRNFKFGEHRNKCTVENVDVVVTLVYYYPKWTNKKSASKKAQKLWRSLEKELVRHEKTHGKYFKETMRKIEKEILRTTGRLSNRCRGMAGSAKRRMKMAHRRGEVKHAAFDRRERNPATKLRKIERAFIKVR